VNGVVSPFFLKNWRSHWEAAKKPLDAADATPGAQTQGIFWVRSAPLNDYSWIFFCSSCFFLRSSLLAPVIHWMNLGTAAATKRRTSANAAATAALVGNPAARGLAVVVA
jgi:hypothetical protein